MIISLMISKVRYLKLYSLGSMRYLNYIASITN
ncbi:hypothetical protein PVAP13_9KG238113 [Panicum virgatum]|uniref:Uncharacterized protein n=1 Tax=Panicum virgatum TaxID=38727 RepID=A0A8T0NLM3_PANVG|nr:hypothetical protein PVAP13_9KG238113 [Panicum virgatum]